MHLFIDKTLRNLLLSQEATLVLSPGKCSYRGNVYVYEPFTIDEIEAKRLELLRLVNKKEFFIAILDKLRF